MTKKSKTARIPAAWIDARPDEDWLFIVCRALHFLGRPTYLADIAKLVAKHPRACGWDQMWLRGQVGDVIVGTPGVFSWREKCDFKDRKVRKLFDEFDKARRRPRDSN